MSSFAGLSQAISPDQGPRYRIHSDFGTTSTPGPKLLDRGLASMNQSFVMSTGHWQVEGNMERDPNTAKNGLGQTTLNIISTIMGGGIVSIPYAYAVAGPEIGFMV